MSMQARKKRPQFSSKDAKEGKNVTKSMNIKEAQ